MHRLSTVTRVVIEKGKITFIAKAIWQNKAGEKKEIDVFKKDEDGNCYIRHIYYNSYGYFVAFPGEVVNMSYGDQFVEPDEDWVETNDMSIGGFGVITKKEKEMIVNCYPEFRYVLSKYRRGRLMSVRKCFSLLQFWKMDHHVELLVACGRDDLAINKRFFKLSSQKQMQVIRIAREYEDMKLNTILEIMKKKISLEEMMEFLCWCKQVPRKRIKYDVYKYLKRKGIADWDGYSLYMDYYRMLSDSDCSHSIDDKYWVFPVDLRKAHDRLLEEKNEKIRIKALIASRKKDLRQKKFEKIYRKLLNYNVQVGIYQYLFTSDLQEWNYQADYLHQCIIGANYMDRVARKECILCFIRVNEKPYATVEIRRNCEIGQFYGNELDRNNCLPDEDCASTFKNWYASIKQELCQCGFS